MLVFPNCKINLGLHITQKRADGFHNLKTVFYPLPLCDCLEIIEAPDQKTTFTLSGYESHTLMGENLCQKAYKMLVSHHPVPAVNIHLHKNIPSGAGLGGGSSDAAFTLLLLNKLFDLRLGREQLMQYAARLGSDCAFFIANQPSYARGRGEILTLCPVSLKGYYLILVKPPIHIPTAEAFSRITPQKPANAPEYVMAQDVNQWKTLLVNDFEGSVFEKYPQIAEIKQQLYKMGAIYASMSGSGSSVYGLFSKKPATSADGLFKNCFVWKDQLKL